MYRIAICDDDERYAEYLEKLLKYRLLLTADDVMFYRYPSGEALINDLYKQIPFDLLILDMQLGGKDGDETAKFFRKKYPDCLLVFCSGVKLPTVKSFEANAYRYLLKEYDSDQMTKELRSIVLEMKRRADIPTIKAIYRNEIKEIPLDSILYVSLRKHGCSIHIKSIDNELSEIVLSNKRIDEMFSEVEKYDFVYAHNSYFVNLKFVSGIIRHDVSLVGGTILPIARSKEKEFKERLVSYLGKKY